MTEKKKAIFKLQTISREKPNLYLMNDKDEVALEVKVYLEKTNTKGINQFGIMVYEPGKYVFNNIIPKNNSYYYKLFKNKPHGIMTIDKDGNIEIIR